eukprot:scaffold4463_cov51-Attheya_sp.AAC.7
MTDCLSSESRTTQNGKCIRMIGYCAGTDAHHGSLMYDLDVLLQVDTRSDYDDVGLQRQISSLTSLYFYFSRI